MNQLCGSMKTNQVVEPVFVTAEMIASKLESESLHADSTSEFLHQVCMLCWSTLHQRVDTIQTCWYCK